MAEEKAKILTGDLPDFANTAAISVILGITPRRIRALTDERVLATEVPPGGGRRAYKIADTVKAYIEYRESRLRDTSDAGRSSELSIKKLEAEVALKESQGQLHRLKTAIAEGRYIPAEQATEELTDFMASFKKFALNIPSRIAGSLSAYADATAVRGIERGLRQELETMLAAFSDSAFEQQQ